MLVSCGIGNWQQEILSAFANGRSGCGSGIGNWQRYIARLPICHRYAHAAWQLGKLWQIAIFCQSVIPEDE